MGKFVIIIGTQWGDEGKGKVVDLLTERAAAVARFQGGHNAGHTLVIGGKKTELIARALADAQRIRGEGDATAAAIYATAYNRNPEFYSFYRSLQAYKNSLGKDSDVMVVSPDSDFFRYFKSPAPARR